MGDGILLGMAAGGVTINIEQAFLSFHLYPPIVALIEDCADLNSTLDAVARGLVRARAGTTMQHVVDETLFVTDMDAAPSWAARVRGNAYGSKFEMTSTWLGVERLAHPDYGVEIKCLAET